MDALAWTLLFAVAADASLFVAATAILVALWGPWPPMSERGPLSMRTRLWICCLAVLAVILTAVVAQAQTINPTVLDFDHADYAQTDQYEVGYFSAAAAVAPVQTANLAKPAACAPCSGTLPSRPTQFGNWWVAVRAAAGGAAPVTSDWSNRIPFVRAPVAPVARGVR